MNPTLCGYLNEFVFVGSLQPLKCQCQSKSCVVTRLFCRVVQLPSPKTAQSTVRTIDNAGNSTAPTTVPLEHAITPPDFKRQKVPLEKGFSQMDWLKLKRTGKDLNGQPLDGAQPIFHNIAMLLMTLVLAHAIATLSLHC
jgi:hypothetical protein